MTPTRELRAASLEAGRAQLSAVSQWMGAFRQTR